MALTERQLTLATLDRQRLLHRSDEPWRDTARGIGAIQAQEPASPYLALAIRSHTFDADEMDAALDTGSLVKCSAMRLTLHLVDAADHGFVRAAMLPLLRAAGLNDRRFTDTGLTNDDADRFAERLTDLAADPIGKDEIDELLYELVDGKPPPGLWRALRYMAPIRHAADATQPWRFARAPRFIAAPTAHNHDDHLDAVARLLERYLAAFGPASRRDAGQFTMLRQPALVAAAERLGDRLRHVDGPKGPLLDVADGTVPDDPVSRESAAAPPRLLPMWDSTLLAYADRSRIIPEQHRAQVIRRNGDTLPTVLLDGQVAGVWRFVDGDLELTAFESVADHDLAVLADEAARLRSLVEPRDTALYGRFQRWWPRLDGRRIVLPLG